MPESRPRLAQKLTQLSKGHRRLNLRMSEEGGSLSGKIVLVTGAGRGIGRAVVLAFARAGAGLVLCSRTPAELEASAQEAGALGAPVLAMACDVADPEQVRSLVAAAVERFGAIDVLVNNAGILGPRQPLAEVSSEDWEEVLRVNLSGVFHVTRQVLRATMLERRWGCVINVSSGAGRRGKAGFGPYAASKFGVEGLTQAWAEECREAGIRFYSLSPGPTRTRMRSQAYPAEDPATLKPPDAVGEAFVSLAKESCAIPTGAALQLDPATGRLL